MHLPFPLLIFLQIERSQKKSKEARLTSSPQLVNTTTYTAPPTSPASINDDADIQASVDAVMRAVKDGQLDLEPYDGILIACYSVHPLVQSLRHYLEDRGTFKPVTGIFEATILTSQLLIGPPSHEKWGIVTTGKFWEDHLDQGVRACLGHEDGRGSGDVDFFAGVFTTGLNAGDFHNMPKEEVDRRLTEATKKLFGSGSVTCVVMGCAGMAGLESIIRAAAAEVNGGKEMKNLHVVDGVKAGVMQLDQAVRSRKIFGL